MASAVLTLSDDELQELAQRVAAILAERQPDADAWIGVREAAEYLACPRSRIYALASARRIPHERDGTRLLFKRSQLDEFVRDGGGRRP